MVITNIRVLCGRLNAHYVKIYNLFIFQDVRLIEKFAVGDRRGVAGLTCFENKIYVVGVEAQRVQVFASESPFTQLNDEEIEIKEMKLPCDIKASKPKRTIFICDISLSCLWSIQIPSRYVIRWKLDYIPFGLSINLSDELLVNTRTRPHSVNVYSSSDVKLLNTIPMPTEITWLINAFQSSKGNLIILYKNKTDPLLLISELSVDGKDILKTFDISSFADSEVNSDNWSPDGISLDNDDNIFVIDSSGDRVFVVGSSNV